jgi:hypothetical protein
VDAEVVTELEKEEVRTDDPDSLPPHGDVEALRKALEAERELVERLRQSKLDLERRAAAAESELEESQGQEPSLLRRLFDKGRTR